jgi:glycosyltransferase involved in cell wall biosynthesis
MNNAKALFFPSKNETFGKPLVEAMMSSVPAAASNIEALSELAVDNKLLSDPNDIENFADKLHDALNVGSSYLARAKSKAENFTYKNHFKNIFSTFLEEIE